MFYGLRVQRSDCSIQQQLRVYEDAIHPFQRWPHPYNMIIKRILGLSSSILILCSIVSLLFFIPSKLWTSVAPRKEDTVPALKKFIE